MKNIDLSAYDLGELKGLLHDIDLEMKNRQQLDLQKAREQVLAIAQESGVSVEELLHMRGNKQKQGNSKKVQPRYRHPSDDSQTWSGRGRQPKWIAEGLANGRTLEDFRIESMNS